MALHDVSRNIPAPFQTQFHARNRDIPNAPIWARVARGYNACLCRQRKLILCKSQHLRSLFTVGGGAPGNGFAWPFFFRTSESSTVLQFHIGLTASDDASGVPRISIELRRTDGGHSPTKAFNFTAQDEGITIGGGDIAHKSVRIIGLTPLAEYHGIVRYTNGARLVYMTVREESTPIADDVTWLTHTNPTQFINGGPIERAAQVDINAAAVALWRHNAGHLFSWTANYSVDDGTLPTIESTSPVPVLGASVPGLHLNMTNRGTLQRRDEIPCRMAVYVNITDGGTTDMEFRLRGTGGQLVSMVQEVTSFDPGNALFPWVVGDVVMPEQNTSWVMEVDTNGRTVTIGGWSLYQWED